MRISRGIFLRDGIGATSVRAAPRTLSASSSLDRRLQEIRQCAKPSAV
jgi:hypothetical protein